MIVLVAQIFCPQKNDLLPRHELSLSNDLIHSFGLSLSSCRRSSTPAPHFSRPSGRRSLLDRHRRHGSRRRGAVRPPSKCLGTLTPPFRCPTYTGRGLIGAAAGWGWMRVTGHLDVSWPSPCARRARCEPTGGARWPRCGQAGRGW
jgi:hypothetical protein